MILALHSSPVQKGNLESMVLRIAEASGISFEMIRLSDLDIKPCKGCLECTKTRRCIHDDDMSKLYDQLEKAEGFVIGGVNYNDRLNATGHLFLERLYPLYHHEPVFRGKPVAIAAVGGEDPAPASQDLEDYLEKIWCFDITGRVSFKSGIYPCFSCGFGTKCQAGMPSLHWSPEKFAAFRRVSTGLFHRFEDDGKTASLCNRIGRSLGFAVSDRRESC
ncbi:MAG: flavodoxin family protein [Thermovirgaceae bacterium]